MVFHLLVSAASLFGGFLLGMIVGTILVMYFLSRYRQAGEDRINHRHKVPHSPGSVGLGKLIDRCLNALLESKEMHALAVAKIKNDLPPSLGPLENVEFKSLDLKASKTEIFPMVTRENWPQDGWSTLEFGLSLAAKCSVSVKGRLGGYAMNGIAGFESASARGCIIMPPEAAAPLHVCFLETPRIDVFVNVPGLTSVIHTFISTALRVAVFPAAFRVPIPVPGTIYENALPGPVTSIYAPFIEASRSGEPQQRPYQGRKHQNMLDNQNDMQARIS